MENLSIGFSAKKLKSGTNLFKLFKTPLPTVKSVGIIKSTASSNLMVNGIGLSAVGLAAVEVIVTPFCPTTLKEEKSTKNITPKNIIKFFPR
jgi:hypothetical protein